METLLHALEKSLGSSGILVGAALAERFPHIWRTHETLKAKALVLPRSTSQVSAILKICHRYDQPVVVHGGLTNLVRSTESSHHDLVISTERMSDILEVDTKSRTITVQAGVVLQRVQQAASDQGLLFPLNFGAKGSAQMGGIIATNAGGLRVLKYGMTRNMVLGLEVVLADGTLISSMKKIAKDNTGYDLKQLFIGSEGTLGVITKAILKLGEAPKSRNSAFVAFNDYEGVVTFLRYMDAALAGTLSAFEIIWKATYQAMTGPSSSGSPPLPYDYKYYVLLESLGSQDVKDRQQFLEVLENALAKELILDAVPAHSESESERFWGIRENVDVIVSQCRHDQHFDISLPVGQIGNVVEKIISALMKIPQVEKVFSFGHVADGNIHLVIGKNIQSEDLKRLINNTVYEPLQQIGGSISAEHGIGIDKKPYLHLSRSPAEIQLMKTLKQALDPKDILNRGKVLV